MADLDQDEGDTLDNDQEGSLCEDGVRRPMNAFFIFCKRHRDIVREKYPHLENRSITKILGEWWANLDSSEKSSYTALARQYKEAFMKAHPDFKWYKLPSVPVRTLMTRPSNNRSQTGKKDKKSSLCGIALGKLADEEHLGGLSSLLLPKSEALDSQTDNLLESPVSPCPVTSSSSSIISKPPKKRYLEYISKTESGSYDTRDDKTQNACSALLELAEICVNTANHSLPNSKHDISNEDRLFEEVMRNNNVYKSSSISPNNYCNDAISSNGDSSLATSSFNNVLSTCNNVYVSPVSDLQEQPLNLSTHKGKMFTTSNQQLIDCVVNKFLCKPKETLNLSILPGCNKSEINCQSLTLSEAIESAIDQAYSKDLVECNSSDAKPLIRTDSFEFSDSVAKTVPDLEAAETKPGDETEVVFIDKIKKACLASSRKSQEKPSVNRYASYLSSANIDYIKTDALPSPTDKANDGQKLETYPNVQNTALQKKSSFHECANPKVAEKKFSSSKYYSKFLSPPKKSQVWCNLFMREQLENSDSEERTVVKKSTASPVRRKSQRTCKGRRYQALINQGLLQSTKERKAAAAKKGSSSAEKCKGKSVLDIDCSSIVLKSKKKKKDLLGKVKLANKEGDKEQNNDKNVFDLNEKIASLPKCSIEMLNNKRTPSPSSRTRTAESQAKKANTEVDVEGDHITDTAAKNEHDSSSSGRFKSGSFDLEQHIASLPKCDIEVLNKRRIRKD